MSLPTNITKEHLLKGIEKIDKEGIPKGGDSQYYDVLYNNKKYPPKLVVSYANLFANGEILDKNSFAGGMKRESFKILKENGFTILNKKIPNIWIEKTLNSQNTLGIKLWSPQKGKRGADIYQNMRRVKKGDIILHLLNNEKFSGISVAKNEFQETTIEKGTPWDGPCYLIDLKDYKELNPAIPRNKVLSIKNRDALIKVREKFNVFYNSELNLNQGAYLTPCPDELLRIINAEYLKLSKTNLPFIMQPIESKIKTSFSIKQMANDFNSSGLMFNKDFLLRFVFSLLTKPFVILTGLSGSGKTKLALAFAKWICEDEKQFRLVPVGSDWTNREPLLGFPNALEEGNYISPDTGILDLIIEASRLENKNKPYFLILDEMNLSHVERYFADFLSAMESNEPILLHPENDKWNSSKIPANIYLPSNLFIIGTVNIDETTYMFSPKVLDRANVIEFRVSSQEMQNYFDMQKKLELDILVTKGAGMAENFLSLTHVEFDNNAETDEMKEVLLQYFNELKKVGAEFGYRSALDILRFATIAGKNETKWQSEQIRDIAILQKLLPKLHGSRRKLEPILKAIGQLCLKDSKSFDDLVKTEINISDLTVYHYPLSFEKIARMYNCLVNNGFTSFAEA